MWMKNKSEKTSGLCLDALLLHLMCGLCSGAAGRKLLSGDVQAGAAVRLPLCGAGLLERTHS